MSNPRSLLLAIGAAALCFALVLGIAVGLVSGAAAQTPTPAGEAKQETTAAGEAKAQAYDAFVAALASELGVDAAQVDAAIRTVLKQRIAEQLAAGEITDEAAAARTAVIDVTDAPLALGGHHDGWGHGGGDGERGRGDRDGDRDLAPGGEDDGGEDPGVGGEAPDSLPSTDDPDVAATPAV